MIELLTDPNAWISLATLAALEIVLGIDNIIFISIASARLPVEQQPRARRLGLILALVGRLILLASLAWIIGLTEPTLEIGEFALSWRDIVLLLGGALLIVKGTIETHHMLEGQHEEATAGSATFGG